MFVLAGGICVNAVTLPTSRSPGGPSRRAPPLSVAATAGSAGFATRPAIQLPPQPGLRQPESSAHLTDFQVHHDAGFLRGQSAEVTVFKQTCQERILPFQGDQSVVQSDHDGGTFQADVSGFIEGELFLARATLGGVTNARMVDQDLAMV